MSSAPDLDVRNYDRGSTGLVLILCVLLIEWASMGQWGDYWTGGIFLVGCSLVLCALAIALPASPKTNPKNARRIPLLLALGIVIQVVALIHSDIYRIIPPGDFTVGILIVGSLAIIHVLNRLRSLRFVLLLVAVSVFFVVTIRWMQTYDREYYSDLPNQRPAIDVMMFQEKSAAALLAGRNPFDPAVVHYPSPYRRGTPFYGPGVVDSDNYIRYGFPYYPVSLLLAIPGWLAGEVRWSHLAALVLSALMMYLANPGRRGALCAMFLLLSYPVFWVLDNAWTEPLLVFTLSLTLVCAMRWPRLMPYALGIFIAAKQYTVLYVPLVPLLIPAAPGSWRKQLPGILLKGAIVAAVVTLPFFLWNPGEFWRAVVQWQFVQPFRPDALSFLAMAYRMNGHHVLPIWTPFAAVIPAIALCLWRCPRTPSGFAAAVTLVSLAFFAFNKQAFCNYYFFVIAAACWAVSAMKVGNDISKRREAS